tara:strand:+ start:272 stop:994 length:723 start_codon:yes stop_codon:yes gene_type:complete
MISLLNFIDTGFIITLGLLLLFTGAVMLYCYRRLNVLENSLIEHGKILQNFIVNYNNQVLVTQQSQFRDLKSVSTLNINSGDKNKISVSDDENNLNDEEEQYDESDNYDEESNENSDEESYRETDEESQVENNDINEKDLVLKNDTIDSTNEQNTEDVFSTNLPIDLNELNELNEINLDSKIIKLETPETEVETSEKVNEKKNYTRMKVDELRSLVVTKDLKNNEEAQKLQKKDLLKLLQ